MFSNWNAAAARATLRYSMQTSGAMPLFIVDYRYTSSTIVNLLLVKQEDKDTVHLHLLPE